MPTLDVPRAEWWEFFDRFARRHVGSVCTLEVRAAEDLRVPFRELVLEAIATEGAPPERRIVLGASALNGSRVVHVIEYPVRVRLDQTEAGGDLAVKIETKADGTALLWFSDLTEQRTVLLVEDDAGLREQLSRILREFGYRSAGASHGREALEYLRCERPPGLILLDLDMPVMSGPEFRTEQRKDPRLAPIPVVVLSGDNSTEQAALSLGIERYVKKPVQLDQLLGVVEFYCG
jgi:CheY-like chemotaxis protein